MKEQSLVYNAIFSDGHFEREHLGELINKGGAAGKIYACREHPEMVAKIFHNRKKSRTNRQKLEAMLQNKPNILPIESNGKTYVQIAWPEAVLEDEEGFCVGYLMPFINTDEAVSLDHLMQKAVRQKEHLSENYKDRINAAFNITAVVAALHQCGHYIIDLKPANVSVYKDNMAVALYDCDGFSIKGPRNRYPAEYVSEEYIYPEGMNKSPEEMGEEQDKFALAVIIFKLLNNGIHPFAGTLRKKEKEALDIQSRIEQYHYAYGIWPDDYQDPHPYSMHAYFAPETLKLFDRAFVKGQKRPSAKEWYEHLKWLSRDNNLKKCKKNSAHVYFTNKGCGLCAVEDKFKHHINDLKKQRQEPQKIRGMVVSDLTLEKNQALKKQQRREFVRLNKLALVLTFVHLLFWSLCPLILCKYAKGLTAFGYFAQIALWLVILKAVFYCLDMMRRYLPLFKKDILFQMLKIYVVINAFISFWLLNEFHFSFFDVALK
ncbi:MAG: hypothetical protein IJ830_04510 [Alphaproteobacteria bacterium]|nr:hypothetical protein [Alphaproteobacteria bacterium]